MPKRNYDEEDWLDLYLTQRRYPEWSLTLEDAYYSAFESFEGWQRDPDGAHDLACTALKTGWDYSRGRKKRKANGFNESIIRENSLPKLKKALSKILEHRAQVQLLPLQEKREAIRKALTATHIDHDLSLSNYGQWLRYTYWTDEEAVEFALGSREHAEFEGLLTKTKKAQIFRNKDLDIKPVEYCNWVLLESRDLAFRKQDLETMDPKSVDTMDVKRKKKLYSLLLALKNKLYGSSKVEVKELASACDLIGCPVSADTIQSILDDAKSEMDP